MNGLARVFSVLLGLLPTAAHAQNVVTYHNGIERHGAYVIPGLTLAAAATMHPDPRFHATIEGHVYAQPLYWLPQGATDGRLIVATESNDVYALDAATGAEVWKRNLGSPVSLSELPCGNIDPDGITGTPVIDPAARVVYLDALTSQKSGPRHLIYALSLADGSVVSKWPLDVQAQLARKGIAFSSSTQGERSALQLFRGNLYVNFGGNWGDCGSYRGMVIQIQTSAPELVAIWTTRANGGGIWAQGGIASDGEYLYATTGNTSGAKTWSGGEAIVRLQPGLAYPSDPRNYFTPSDWQQLDHEDRDLGGTGALPLDIGVPGAPTARRVIAFGKDGNAYLADRTNLGGVGGALAVKRVSNKSIITAPAVYETSTGTMVAVPNRGGGKCPVNNLTMLTVIGIGKFPIGTVWCAPFQGGGAPIVTTTDGRLNPVVWIVGAEGDNVLHGFNALTGRPVFSGRRAMSGLHHFVTILAAQQHLYVAADNTVYAYGFDHSD